jgi:transcriptional regulator with GAF, ATPase, and Fis domain
VTREWGGNVRELANYLERGVLRAAASAGAGGAKDGEPSSGPIRLELRHLAPARAPGIRQPFRIAKEKMTEEWTRSTLTAALEECGGSATEAAKRLQMGRTAFLRLVKKLRIRE